MLVDQTNLGINLLLAIVGGIGALLGIIISHFLARNRSVNELLFSARREIYSEFLKEFGMAFGPEKIIFQESGNFKDIELDYERRQKINRTFAQCRLVASPLLERKLRDLYELIVVDLKNHELSKTSKKRERDYIGYEIEALMRRDLNAIGMLEVFLWRSFSFWKRIRLQKI